MEFQDFIEKQDGIYSRFRDTFKVEQEGIVQNVPQLQGGYLIAYRHPRNIADALGEFSEKVSKIVPSLTYDAQNAHTTISDYQVGDDFFLDRSILQNLSEAVSVNLSSLKKQEIDYQEWLLNQNTGLAGGIPNPSFLENAEKIIESVDEKGIQLRLPWGVHITTNRFLENKSPEEIAELINLFKTSKPLGVSKPDTIDVAYFYFTPKGFDFNTYNRFSLN